MPARCPSTAQAVADPGERVHGGGGLAVERILFYTKVENERPWIIEDRRPPANWPVKPTIVMVRD